MSLAQYNAWQRDGRPFMMAVPLLDLRATLGSHGYNGPQTGYPDQAHLTASLAEDHCPYSQTPWPGPQPYPYCLALDIMPDPALDLVQLGEQLVADKLAGVPGTEPIKYINWTDSDGNCWHDEWTPDHSRYASTDRGHIHISIRTDYVTSSVMRYYDPIGGAMDPEARMWLYNTIAIVTAIAEGKDEAECRYAWTGDGHAIGDTFKKDLRPYWDRHKLSATGDHTHDIAGATSGPKAS